MANDSFKGQSYIKSVAFLFSLARKYKDVCIEPARFLPDKKRFKKTTKRAVPYGIPSWFGLRIINEH